jgi:hypothetical protein
LELPWCSKSKTLKLFHGVTLFSGYTLFNTMIYDHRIVKSHRGLPNVLYPQKQRECINTSKRVLEHISV